MTQVLLFQPQPVGVPFQFPVRLDGADYNAEVRWNTYGSRWYLCLFDLRGTVILLRPMVGSPPDYDVSLTAGFFSTSLVYREASQQIEVG